jgi:exodeoxyribonuclease VII small subunit
MSEKLTYSKAIEELQSIIDKMENSSIDPDQLLELVKRASILLDFCEKKLLRLEGEINQILQNIQSPPAPETENEA